MRHTEVKTPLYRQSNDTVDTAWEGDTGQREEGGQDEGEYSLLVQWGEGGKGEGESHKHLRVKSYIESYKDCVFYRISKYIFVQYLGIFHKFKLISFNLIKYEYSLPKRESQ